MSSRRSGQIRASPSAIDGSDRGIRHTPRISAPPFRGTDPFFPFDIARARNHTSPAGSAIPAGGCAVGADERDSAASSIRCFRRSHASRRVCGGSLSRCGLRRTGRVRRGRSFGMTTRAHLAPAVSIAPHESANSRAACANAQNSRRSGSRESPAGPCASPRSGCHCTPHSHG